jgi:hypothetical protein
MGMVSKIYKSTLNGFILLQGIELWKNTSSEEIYSMVYESGASLRDQAIILYTSVLRNSTLRALHYGDIKEELEAGIALLLIDIKPDILKARVHIAAKGRIPYYTFISKKGKLSLKKLCYAISTKESVIMVI